LLIIIDIEGIIADYVSLIAIYFETTTIFEMFAL